MWIKFLESRDVHSFRTWQLTRWPKSLVSQSYLDEKACFLFFSLSLLSFGITERSLCDTVECFQLSVLRRIVGIMIRYRLNSWCWFVICKWIINFKLNAAIDDEIISLGAIPIPLGAKEITIIRIWIIPLNTVVVSW